MIHMGSIVRILKPFSRRTRGANISVGVVLTDPFEDQKHIICPVGFFSRKSGPWTRMMFVEDLQETDISTENVEDSSDAASYKAEYRIWISMRRRCSDPRNQGFYLYKNRVTVCPEWEQSFERFFADMGKRPSPKHSLDRIDNNGNYEPGNVRWATPKEQSRNTSKTQFLTAFGQTKPLTQWAEELGITSQALHYRITKKGWDVETAVSRPKGKSKPYLKGLATKRKRGTEHYRSKLTETEVLQIRELYAAGKTQAFLARAFSVAYGTIAYIVKNRTWVHLLPTGKDS